MLFCQPRYAFQRSYYEKTVKKKYFIKITAIFLNGLIRLPLNKPWVHHALMRDFKGPSPKTALDMCSLW